MSLFPFSFRKLGELTAPAGAIASILLAALILSLALELIARQRRERTKATHLNVANDPPASDLGVAVELPDHKHEAATATIPKQRKTLGWLWIIAVAVTSLLGNWMFFLSVTHLNPAISVSVQRTELIFVAILGALFLQEPFNARLGIAIAFSLVGIWVLQGAEWVISWQDWFGIMVTLVSALSFAFMLFFSKLALGYFPANQINIARLMLIASVVLLYPVSRENLIHLTAEGWMFAFTTAILGPFGSRMMLTQAIKQLAMAKALLITMSAPIITYVWQWLMLGISLSIFDVVGAGLILLGIGYVLLPNIHKR